MKKLIAIVFASLLSACATAPRQPISPAENLVSSLTDTGWYITHKTSDENALAFCLENPGVAAQTGTDRTMIFCEPQVTADTLLHETAHALQLCNKDPRRFNPIFAGKVDWDEQAVLYITLLNRDGEDNAFVLRLELEAVHFAETYTMTEAAGLVYEFCGQ